MIVQNAKQLPKRYFGLHMAEGVAEYKEPQVNEGRPYRILVTNECLNKMDQSYEGKPVYVMHVQDVNLDNLQNEMDGTVVRSFYNALDGKHWVEFMITSDKGHEAIAKGWKLSNAYIPKEMIGGGHWHGVDYIKEVMNAEYEHLALVPDPRYAESIILTPEEFKKYNSEKELELKKLSNSKGNQSMFGFFKKTKVENSKEMEETSVILPASKVEITIAAALTELDKIKNMHGYANGDHMVKVGEHEMTVNELVSKHMELQKKHDELTAEEKPEEKKNEEKPEEKVEEKKEENMTDKEALEKDLELAEHEKQEIEGKKLSEADKGKEEMEKKKNSNFEALKNAEFSAIEPEQKVDLSMDRLARGKARYGSK